MNGYHTLGQSAQCTRIVQKSRFIGFARPVQDEGDALSWLARVRAEHRAATHNCYAYIIGANRGVMRHSDDGEPSGTAGIPILEVLRAQEVTDCLIVVTRYFGGILLGAGGLVRAYGGTAAEAVRASGVVAMTPSREYALRVPYPLWARLQHSLCAAPCMLLETAYADCVSVRVLCKTADAPALETLIAKRTDGRVTPECVGERHHPWPE